MDTKNTQQIIDETKLLWQLVWDVRRMLGDEGSKWVTPPPEDAAWYLIEELGEYARAKMLMKRPEDARNNKRDADMVGEAADMMIMACTVYRHVDWDNLQNVITPCKFHYIPALVGDIFEDAYEKRFAPHDMIRLVAGLLETNITADDVKRRLARIVWNHGRTAYRGASDTPMLINKLAYFCASERPEPYRDEFWAYRGKWAAVLGEDVLAGMDTFPVCWSPAWLKGGA